MAALSALAAYDVSDAESNDEVENGNKEQNVEELSSDSEVQSEEEPNDLKNKASINSGIDEVVNESDEDSDHMMVSSEDEVTKETEPKKSKPSPVKFKRYSCESATALAVKLQKMEDEAQLPPEPDGRCTKHLQDKIKRLFEEKIKEGKNLNQAIQERKDFRNPSIYDKLILYLKIEERGTNFPKTDFHPSSWRKAPDYEDLARAQREDVAKRERERKTKVEFVTGTVKKPSGSGSAENVKRTKWDTPADDSKTSQSLKSASATSNSSSKTTIIPPVGTIKKTKP